MSVPPAVKKVEARPELFVEYLRRCVSAKEAVSVSERVGVGGKGSGNGVASTGAGFEALKILVIYLS